MTSNNRLANTTWPVTFGNARTKSREHIGAGAFWLTRARSVAAAVGTDVKGKVSVFLYAIAVPLAFANRWLAIGLYVAVAVMWLIPDRRIERTLA